MKGDHTTIHNGYTISYWLGSTACGSEDAWTHATFYMHNACMATVETIPDLRDLKALLDSVFLEGKRARSKEIADLLMD